MDLSAFDFDLPPGRIAEHPAVPRDAARMLVVARQTRTRIDSTFRQLAHFLRPGDTLVVNDTKVINARVFGVLERTGREVEVFFEKPLEENRWEVMLQPGRRIRPGDTVVVDSGRGAEARLRIGTSTGYGCRVIELDSADVSIRELLDAVGHVPLPPYIPRTEEGRDRTDYQTIYAQREGAVAAPTAGLHFTTGVLDSLEQSGIGVERITLHVGVGTFQPVRTEDIRHHRLKAERFAIAAGTARKLNQTRRDGGRIIAVGTTTTRTLEYVFGRHGGFAESSGETDLFIYPGYRFLAVDGLLTNFHLPRSTLLMLVSAFAGVDTVRDSYRHAVESGYRFYSFGDATLFL